MASGSSNKLRDLGWSHNYCKNPNNKNLVTCNYCGKVTSGGINRAKQHQMGGFRDATACTKVPPHVREELIQYVKEKKRRKDELQSRKPYRSPVRVRQFERYESYDSDDEVENLEVDQVGKKIKTEGGSSSGTSKEPRFRGPLDKYKFKRETPLHTNLKQAHLKEKLDKEARGRACAYLARWMYQAGIPFNAANLPSFQDAVSAVGEYGPGLKAPSGYELGNPLLTNEVEYTKNLMQAHYEAREKYGCSIMSDGWTDRRGRTIINFLVNTNRGTMFIESVDASAYMKTAELIFELLDRFVDRIGEEHVVQLVTDNGANYKKAGDLLELKRKQLFWTPCAAHCIDLVLEDIGKIPKIKQTLKRAISMVGYIYNHAGVLSLFRKFNGDKDIPRGGVTRFATSFLTMTRVKDHRNSLIQLFTSEDWEKGKWASDAKGRRAVETVLLPSFWNTTDYLLAAMGPLVSVLRLADNESIPAMGYIYHEMRVCLHEIKTNLGNIEKDWKPIIDIVQKRWKCQLHHALHATGYLLNPHLFYYIKPCIWDDEEISNGFYETLKKLVPSLADQRIIMREMSYYMEAEGSFGLPMAIDSRKNLCPAEWWKMHGQSASQLQKLAMKVLNLTISATGCERNWSTFEAIHTKKRNRIEHEKCEDLVFIKYNQKLKSRFDLRNTIDPLFADEVDWCSEWMVGEMEEDQEQEMEEDQEPEQGMEEPEQHPEEVLFPNIPDLPLKVVAEASGITEPVRKYLRRKKVTSNNDGDEDETNLKLKSKKKVKKPCVRSSPKSKMASIGRLSSRLSVGLRSPKCKSKTTTSIGGLSSRMKGKERYNEDVEAETESESGGSGSESSSYVPTDDD